MEFFKFLERKGTVVFMCLVSILISLGVCVFFKAEAMLTIVCTAIGVVGGWMFTANMVSKFSKNDSSSTPNQ